MKNYLPGDIEELEFALSANWADLALLGEEENGYIHVKRGGNILGVAHADTYGAWTGAWTLDKANLIAPTIDNRLGLWTVLYLLPALGIKADVLITDGEERGASTATAFKKRDYNWCVSFDRGGTDTVLYQHEAKKWRSLLTGYGFEVGTGSFSDLAALDIGVFGMNIGCGMKNYHSQGASADLWALYDNAMALVKFYRDLGDIRLESVPKPKSRDVAHRWDWGEGEGATMLQCSICKKWKPWLETRWDAEQRLRVCDDCAEPGHMNPYAHLLKGRV